MTETDTAHYKTLSPDHQLIWRLLARRNIDFEEPELYRTGESQDTWASRMYALSATGKYVYLALDVMAVTLLDSPPEWPDGMLRTAWVILKTDADVFTSLGHEDATRLEALARHDAGPLISRDAFEDVAVSTCIHQEERLNAVLCTPGEEQELVTHPASSSLSYLKYAVKGGLTLEGASPDLQAAIARLLAADVDWEPGRGSELTEVPRSFREVPADLQRDIAFQCVVLIIRLLHLPQLVPAKVDVKLSLECCALTWRVAHDLWKGEREWQADLDLIRAHLRTIGRANDHFKKMRSLEPYGPAVLIDQVPQLLQQGMKIHADMITFAHMDVPDIDPVVLSTLDTRAGQLAGRLAHVVMSSIIPRIHWGVHMRTLDARIQNIPPPDAFDRVRKSAAGNTEQSEDLLMMIESGARAALLLALSETPGREVLAACAAGLAHLKEVTARGAPIGSMTLEFDAAVRTLWRSLGCPPCTWLSAAHGPTGTESRAWGDQLEALIEAAQQRTPDVQPPVLPAPETYAHIPWQQHATEEENTDDTTLFATTLTPAEKQVLKALEGKTLVVLGGICKPHAKAALIRDLNLKDVDWIESTEYDNGHQAASRLRDPNIVAVIFALRWAGHAHGSIRDVAWSLGIPAVSLPGGYSPRQVLHQLSAQVSGSLAS
jgi:hypothetical protein